MFPFNDSYIKKVRSVRPDRLVALWPQNEPLGHGISTEVIRGYNGAYTAVTLGQTGLPGSGMTSAGYDGAASYNNIYAAGLANDNLLSNPGFETPGAMPPTWVNWSQITGDGAIANEVVIVHEGIDAAKLTGGATFNTYIYQNIVVIPGERRRFRFWSRGDGANAGRYRIRDNTNGVDILLQTTTGITAAAWGMVTYEYMVPAGCVLVREYVYCPPVNGGIAYFDACEDRRMDGFLGDQGTLLAWARASGAGVWTDGFARMITVLRVDADNRLYLRKGTVNNTIGFQYEAGNVAEFFETAGHADLGFMAIGSTWSRSDNEFRGYKNGVQEGLQINLGTWLGDLANTTTVVGALSTVPASVWSGDIGPVALWSDALTPDEMRYLGT